MIFRAVAPNEYLGVAECLRRNDMSVPSEAEWRTLWDGHPYADEFRDIPRGFVLEVDGVIVGTIFNLWAKYRLNHKTIRVAISGSAAVDPPHRSGSIKLMGETVRQSGVDLYLNGSPSAVAAKIMETLKVRRVPQADYDLSLLWVARGYGPALAGLRRKNVPLARFAALPAGLVLAALSRRKLRAGTAARFPVDVVTEFSEDFDALWEELASRTDRLTAFRDRKMLRWRYARLIARGRARVLSVRRDGRLAGYAILVHSSRPHLGLDQFAMHDIQCVDDDPQLTRALLHAALAQTRHAGFDMLEWVGQSGARRSVAEHAAALHYRLDVWQAYYFTRDPALKTTLAQPEAWSFGPYDSD